MCRFIDSTLALSHYSTFENLFDFSLEQKSIACTSISNRDGVFLMNKGFAKAEVLEL